MNKAQENTKKQNTEMLNDAATDRLRIGFLITEYYDLFTKDSCQGAMRAAEELDANLYMLAGGYLKPVYKDTTKNDYDYQNNFLYEFAHDTNLDALVISLGTICGYVEPEEKRAFLSKFKDIPLITLASKEEGYSSILFDNRRGFAKGVEFLIKEQGRSRIGLVSGPATNADARERLDAYKEVLKKNGLEVRDDRIVYGNFSEYSDEVVNDLLDRNPDLDAIVFANDHMARGGYRVLQERGIKIGSDIAVIGFDDSEFASLMTPGLTTTRADSQDLGYQAMVHACEIARKFKEGTPIADLVQDFRVDTTLMVRDSSGTILTNMKESQEDKKDALSDPTKASLKKITDDIFKKVFDFGKKDSNKDYIKNIIRDLIQWSNENIYQKNLDALTQKNIRVYFKECLDAVMRRAHDTNYYYDLVDQVLALYYDYMPTEEDQRKLLELKAQVYHNIHLSVEQSREAYSRANNVLNWIMMDITRDMISESGGEKHYDLLLKKMDMLDYKSSIIMLFGDTKQFEPGDYWERPEKVYVKAYQHGTECYVPVESHQEIATDKIYKQMYVDSDVRKTYSASILFSNKDQYGLLVIEPTLDNLVFIEPIRFQMSSAMQMLSLFNDKEKLNKQLEENLAELRESNAFLDEVSKSDELTQIYNRRGFLVTARKIIKQQENFGKRAVIMYADMNNLKLVNDQFGHEEGDYSLKSIAEILKHSLGRQALVGRMGGDEFAAFMILDKNTKNVDLLSTEEGIRKVIALETEVLNASNDKPYYVSLSAGIRFFDIEIQSDIDTEMSHADDDLYTQKQFKRKSILK